SQSAPTVVITVRATRVWLVDRDLISLHRLLLVLFFIVTAPPSIYTLSLHDALPITVAGALLTHLLLEVELTTEGGEDVHHEADDDEVDAGVEKQCRRQRHGTDQRQINRVVPRRQRRVAEEHRPDRRRGGEEQAGAAATAGVDRQCLLEFGAATRDVAQRERERGDEATREAAAGAVVAGEEEVQREHHHRGEEDARRDVHHEGTVLGT